MSFAGQKPVAEMWALSVHLSLKRTMGNFKVSIFVQIGVNAFFFFFVSFKFAIFGLQQ